MRNVAWVSLAVLVLHCLSLRAFAHDPYEITSTIRLETNRTLVEIEMEFNGAMLLAGGVRPTGPIDQAALFQSKLPVLRTQAGQFFQLANAASALSAASTNVTLGVENHIKFTLVYPPSLTGLKLDAIALKSLAEHGPFGTTVTVLDMVNKTVVGQTVLFSNSPAAEFVPRENPMVNPASVVQTPAAIAPKPPPTVQPRPSASDASKASSARESVWNFVLLGFFGALLLVLLRRWRAAGGSQ